jgi:hypothetical protein
MHAPKHTQIVDGLCRYGPEGLVTLVEAVELVTCAITYCRDQGIRMLLMDVTRLYGHAVPTLVDRFWMAQDWAQASQGVVTVALVALPEHIDPGRFGVKVATDCGLKGDVFTSVAAAEAWLLANGQNAGAQPVVRGVRMRS